MKNAKANKNFITAEDIGNAIRKKRKSSGMNITKAAALCNVGIRFFSELERGKQTAEIGKTLHVMKCMGLELKIISKDNPDET